MNIRLLISTFFCLWCSVQASAQYHHVTATVVNEQGTPIDITWMLYSADSTFMASQYATKGFIDMQQEFTGKALLKIGALGYEDQVRWLPGEINTHELGVITLKPSSVQLHDITVKQQRPVFESNSEGTRVNVANSMLSQSINANEVLSRLPGVSISGTKVNVMGRGEALIYMNGKETSLASFKSIPPSDIKTIDIITNPDARYDAKGKAVILVTLKRHTTQGLQATLVEALTVGIVKSTVPTKYLLNAPNLTLNFRKNKWDIAAYYANEKGTNWMENQFMTTVKAAEGNYKKIGYYTEDNHNKAVHYYRLGVGYTLSKRTSVSVQYDGLSHYFTLDVKQNGDYLTPSLQLTQIRMTNDASTRLVNHSMNVNIRHQLDTVGSYWFIGAQVNRFQNRLLDRITEHITGNGVDQISQRKNDGLNVIHLYTAEADLSKKRGAGSMDVGAKFSYNSNEGLIHFFSKTNAEQVYTENPLFGNATLYREWVPALYAMYKTQYQKLNMAIGLRAEYTVAKGVSKKYNTTLIDTQYANIFPNAKCQYALSDQWKLGASYAYKINRPLYQDLDPFLWYLDSLTSIQGNAQLVPEYIHQQELSLSYKTYALRYGFALSENTITSVMKPGINGVNAVVFTKDNIQHRHTHTFAVDLPFEKNNYSSFTTFAVNAYQFKDSRPAYQSLQSQAQFYLYTYHAYKIPSWCTTELTAEYYSRSADGFTQRRPYLSASLSLSRSFLKNEALQVNLMWNDMARTARWAGLFQVNTYSNDYNQRFTTNYVRLTLTYSLTSKIASTYQNKNVNEAEFNRIKR